MFHFFSGGAQILLAHGALFNFALFISIFFFELRLK